MHGVACAIDEQTSGSAWVAPGKTQSVIPGPAAEEEQDQAVCVTCTGPCGQPGAV